MSELDVQAKKDGGVSEDILRQEETLLGRRKAVYKSEIVPMEEFDSQLPSYREVKLSLDWEEAGRAKESVLSAYMVIIEKEEDEE
jgi:hypothetical protein